MKCLFSPHLQSDHLHLYFLLERVNKAGNDGPGFSINIIESVHFNI